MKEYIVKRINYEDISAIKFIAKIHEALPKAWLNDYDISEEVINNTIEELILNLKSEVTYCATLEEHDNIVSFIWADVNKNNRKQIDIISLWTNEKYRGRGLAKKLKTLLEIWAKNEMNAEKIHTTVSVKNENMIKLNKSLGYTTEYYRMTKYL